jgi:hypothetical protein
MEENIENINSPNDEEIVAPEANEQEPGLPADPEEIEPKDEGDNLSDDPEELKRLLREEKDKQQETYEQLKKAKGFKRDPKTGKWVKPEAKVDKVDKSSSDITIMELKSLLAANIHDDSDSEEVRLYARSHGVSITEALKVPEVKSMIKTRIEHRKTADATNTLNSRRSVHRVSDDELISQMESGKVPEDPAEAARIRYLRRANEITKNKKQ